MPVRRLYIVCERPTEEGFVSGTLRGHFLAASGTLPIPLLPSILDLYAIPDDFPELHTARAVTAAQRVVALEAAFARDVTTDRLWRFTPHLQLHEFEALLLADVHAIARAFPASAPAALAALRADVGHREPEDVDGGRDAAPSKRIVRHFPGYSGAKATSGPVIAADIGLPRLRAACPHFDTWLTTLEARCRG